MMKPSLFAVGMSIGLFATVSALPLDAHAQSGEAAARPPSADAGAGKTQKTGGAVAAGAATPDMRLWSFGDCDRNYPYVETPQHKECVRVVGSDEAKDARAVHFCAVSHALDPTEAARCKEAYFANKAEAEQEGFRKPANPSAVAVPAAVAAKPDKDAAIASLTRALAASDEDEPAAAPVPAREVAPVRPPPLSSSFFAENLMLVLAIVVLLAGIGVLYRRKAAAAEAAAMPTSRKSGGNRKMVGGTAQKLH